MFYTCRQAGYKENPVYPPYFWRVNPVKKVPPQAAKFFSSKKGAVKQCPIQ
jgi:hypothetical protein